MVRVQLTLIAVVVILSVVAVSAFSERLGLAAPLSLVAAGTALSFVPGMPDIHVEPEWILAGVLPPLLYASAVSIPAVDFRRNLKAITGLAVLLVVVTTAGAAVLFHAVLPAMGWPTAFALGAVVSPTDPIAATSVGKKLGLPARLLTVLEGEGLVNDASALVLLKAAIAATAGSVSLWGVSLKFLYSVAAAIVIGVVVGEVNVRLRSRLDDAVLNTAVSFVIPFLAYLPAEEASASGVLAVVVTGLVTGHQSPRFLKAKDRIAERTNWLTVSFLLESGIFLLTGLDLHTLIKEVDATHLSVLQALLLGLAAAALCIVLRMAFVAPLVASLRRDERRAADAKPKLERMMAKLDAGTLPDKYDPKRVTRVSATVDFLLKQTLGWRGGVVLAWSGMRGAITVAAAQTLPDATPYRPQLVLVAFVVAVATLMVQGLTLPVVIRTVKVPGDDPEQLREEYAELLTELDDAAYVAIADAESDSAEAGQAAEADGSGSGSGAAAGSGSGFDPEVVERARADSLRGIRGAMGHADDSREAVLRDQYRRLRAAVLAAERATLLDMRATASYSSTTLAIAQRKVDLEEARIQLIEEEESA